MKTALMMLLLVATTSRALAEPRRSEQYAGHDRSTTITCDTVRAYVGQVGLAQARAMARANGMTGSEERKARQCLARKD
jgi:hypothetical protein